MFRYVLDESVAENILRLSSRQRERFVQIFRTLANNPCLPGERGFKDSQKKEFDRWLISYWPDHAVKEMRIVGVQKSKT